MTIKFPPARAQDRALTVTCGVMCMSSLHRAMFACASLNRGLNIFKLFKCQCLIQSEVCGADSGDC